MKKKGFCIAIVIIIIFLGGISINLGKNYNRYILKSEDKEKLLITESIINEYLENDYCWKKNSLQDINNTSLYESGLLMIQKRAIEKFASININEVNNKELKDFILFHKEYIERRYSLLYSNLNNENIEMDMNKDGLYSEKFSDIEFLDKKYNSDFVIKEPEVDKDGHGPDFKWSGCSIEHPKTDKPNLELHNR